MKRYLIKETNLDPWSFGNGSTNFYGIGFKPVDSWNGSPCLKKSIIECGFKSKRSADSALASLTERPSGELEIVCYNFE